MFSTHAYYLQSFSISFISGHGKFWFGMASITSEHKSVNNVDSFLKFEKICKIAKRSDSYCFSEKVQYNYSLWICYVFEVYFSLASPSFKASF